MTDPLHEAVERLVNPDPGKFTWWEIALLPVGLPLLAVYAAVTWVSSLLPQHTQVGARRCIVPMIQTDADLAKAIVEFTDSQDRGQAELQHKRAYVTFGDG